MKQSELFTKTLREAPKDEEAINAKLLIRSGFIFKEMAGVYSFLPLGLRVLNKIENIIREEMNKIGGTEMRTSVLQNKNVWEKSNRWNDAVVDAWFKTKLKTGADIGLSFTNEEAYSNILKQYVSSYKDLPIYPYDFKNIFRNEARSKSGILRGREFYWKALYSFSRDEAEHEKFYEKAKAAYRNIFKRAGIGHLTYMTFASGGSFSKFSHEFQTITPAGEDTIYLDESSKIAVNKEVYTDEVIAELKLKKNDMIEKRAIEVGNVFSLGTKFSAPFDLRYRNEKGEEKDVIMGSYGIGVSRLMGTIVEVYHDERGIVWPESVAPYRFHLIELKSGMGKDLYRRLRAKSNEVLYDDREISAGEKFADADLIGIPYRLVVSEKTGGKIEVKKRNAKGSKLVSYATISKLL